MSRNKNRWYPLDNAAKIYPPTARRNRPQVFSFSAMLFHAVDSEILQQAATNAVKRNSIFNTRLMRGKFWYYLEQNDAKIKVFLEDSYYLKSIDYKRNNNFLFEIHYTGNRITINFFHALTDGTGGFNFFSQVLLEYFKLMNYNIDSEDKINPIEKPFFYDEATDSFLSHDENPKKAIRPKKIHLPFKINGTPFNYDGCGMITAQVSISQLKALAKSYNATITAYLGGLYIYTIYDLKLRNKAIKNKLISLLIPCNLRKKYGGETMRNFTMFARITADFTSNDISLEKCVEITQNQIQSQLTKENLNEIIHSNVKAEKNPFVKIVPLGIKDIILRNAYVKLGENLQTGIFSNLGLVNLPDSFKSHIKHLTFSIAPTFSCRCQMTAIGYCDNLYITFTRNFLENTIEKSFIKALSSSCKSVKVYSNYWESSP